MPEKIIYRHIDGERYECEAIEVAETQVKVRLPADTAEKLRLAEILWLPRTFLRIEKK